MDLNSVQQDAAWLGQAIQMFMPFMYDIKTSETLFDKVTSGKLNLLPGLNNHYDQNKHLSTMDQLSPREIIGYYHCIRYLN